MENKFDLIKSSLKLKDYAAKVLKLQKNGNRYVALCPFHSESTPSFYIEEAKDLFYCFGCNQGGDLFKFYCLFHKCDKKQALHDLAKITNIEIKGALTNSQALYDLLDFFMDSNEHVQFLLNRGIFKESILKYKLGFSKDFKSVQKYIKNKQLNLELFNFKEYFFKFFENRIVFPIFNNFGNLISFAGRDISDNSKNKYVNGAESSIFKKNEVLYGLNYIQNRSEIFLVEGYIDVILMQQAGYSCVASMGTAVSIAHLELLFSYTNKIIVCMDGDDAGQAAAFKIALLSLGLIKSGKSINFIILESSYDPASYLQEHKNLDNLNIYPLYEFLAIIKPMPEKPDQKALYFKQLNDYAEKIQDEFIKSEYRRYWQNLRYIKRKNIGFEKLQLFNSEYLFLLLFKYVACYNNLLHYVGQNFLKIKMSNEFHKNLDAIFKNTALDESFIKKLSNISINQSLSLEEASKEWYRIFEYIQFLTNKNNHLNILKDDFSESNWDKYKEYITNKEKENE